MAAPTIRVLTGCQMDGLVCALRILFPQADIAGFHTYKLLGEERSAIRDELVKADIIFALPLEETYGDLSYYRIRDLGPQIQFVPHVVFSAFHPDVTYLERKDGRLVQTPMTDYHSVIAVAAFLCGAETDHAIRLYNAFTYQALGYFNLLEGSRRSLLSDFDFHGMDLREALDRWLERPDPFMFSMNHPRSYVLADVATIASRAAGLWHDASTPSFEAMPDHLADWVVYPVFPELAARLGKTGSTQFKLIGAKPAPTLSLETFVARSFEVYAREHTQNWSLTPRLTEVCTLVQKVIHRSASKRRTGSTSKQRIGSTSSQNSGIFARPQHVASISDCYFYHTTDLPGHGTQHGGWDLRGRFTDYVGGLDVRDKRVLDVGTASGFLSFSAEEAGAREVVSFDLDSADRQHLLPFAGSEYVESHQTWSAKQTAGFQLWKNAYWLTHRLRKSKAKVVYGDVYALPDAIGMFDIIILGAIIEHLADPIRALASVARHASTYVVINTDFIETDEPMAVFNGRPDRPSASFVFWTYSIKTYEHVMGIIGFEIEAIQKSAFLARDKDGSTKSLERVALVCRRRAPALAKVA